jgi:hypothetical protein
MHPGTKASIANAACVDGTRAARLWQQLKPGRDRPNGIIHPEVLLYFSRDLPKALLKSNVRIGPILSHRCEPETQFRAWNPLMSCSEGN